MDKLGIEMKSCDRKFLRNIVIAAVPLMLAGLPQTALATTADTDFTAFVLNLCAAGTGAQPPGVVWNTVSLSAMCQKATAVGNIGGPTVSVGSSNAGGGVTARNKKVFREKLDDEMGKSKQQGASADGGGWGLLVSPQYGKSSRMDTQLEHGFDSDLKGLNVGLDYQFSDRFITGVMVGYTRDNLTYLNNTGTIKTGNSSLTLYSTWLPTDSVAVDGYLGYGKYSVDSQRHVIFNQINGTTSSNATGQQLMGGLSASYQMDLGQVNVSPFINLDSIRSTSAGYNETGSTGLELHFRDNKSLSTTTSVGARASTTHGFAWGSLSPSVRVAAVHEFQNNSKVIPVELVSAPSVGINIRTDSPDRNYLNVGAGVTAGLNGGTQLFLNYETRAKDALLKSWAVSAGVLMEF